MKTFCRIMACLLVMIMALSVVACNGKKTEAPKTEAPTTEAPTTGEQPTTGGTNTETPIVNPTETPIVNPTETPVNPGEMVKPDITETFGGTSIKFFINGGEADSVNCRSIALVPDEDGNLPDMEYEVNMQVQKRNNTVEDELQVKIELAGTMNMQEASAALAPTLASGVYAYDVVGLYQYFDLGLALGDTVGSFFNYEDMPEGYTNYLNKNAPYWNQQLYNTLKYGNVAFFITGDLNQATSGTMFVSFVNKRLWEEFGNAIEGLEESGHSKDIYEIVKNGYWNMQLWTKLIDMVYVDTNHNDKVDWEDQTGLIVYDDSCNTIIMDVYVAGAGIHFTETDESGKPYFVFNSDRNTEFYNTLYTMICEVPTAQTPWLEGGDDDKLFIMDLYARGNTLLAAHCLNCAEEYMSEMADDFYVMPLPMLNREQYDPESPSLGYTTQLGDSVNQFAICTAAGVERIPAITATMELMGYYSKLWVTPAYYDTALKNRYTRDTQAAAMIDMIREGVFYDFGLVWSNKLGDPAWYARTHYRKSHANLARNLKQAQQGFQGKLNQLLPQIEEAFYVTTY